MSTSSHERTVLSLFTGAGGLDLGLEAAGFEPVLCVEVDEDSRATLEQNRPSWRLADPGDIHVLDSDAILRQAGLRSRELRLLAGGPPCQPFSKSAYWSNGNSRRLHDPRAYTLRAYVRVVEATLPEVLLLPNVVTPRLLLTHSLAHALIRQLSLSCGYTSASLRERLYVDVGPTWEMVGLLIFTSSPDADGTLGGLARQGESANIVRVFEDALSSMTWCSSDPLCIEGTHARSEPANGAACHACLLAAETSCEEFNTLLDRALLVGTPGQPQIGFFEEHLQELRR